MISKILSNQKFEPKSSLARKYWYYILSITFATVIFLTSMFSFIAYIEGELPRELYWILVVTYSLGLIAIISGYFLSRMYYNSITYEIIDDEVHVFRGIITRTRKIVPYRTITNLDVKQGPFDRLMNLGTIEIQTAGNSAGKIGPEERLDGLPGDLVEEIQEILLKKVRKMRGSAGVTQDLPDEQSILADILDEVRELRKSLQNRD